MKKQTTINAIKEFINKIDELRDEKKHTDQFVKEQLVLIDVLLYAADAMSKELDDKSVAKHQYEVIKAKFDIK